VLLRQNVLLELADACAHRGVRLGRQPLLFSKMLCLRGLFDLKSLLLCSKLLLLIGGILQLTGLFSLGVRGSIQLHPMDLGLRFGLCLMHGGLGLVLHLM
jgi:hypothetical protein